MRISFLDALSHLYKKDFPSVHPSICRLICTLVRYACAKSTFLGNFTPQHYCIPAGPSRNLSVRPSTFHTCFPQNSVNTVIQSGRILARSGLFLHRWYSWWWLQQTTVSLIDVAEVVVVEGKATFFSSSLSSGCSCASARRYALEKKNKTKMSH